MSVSIRLDTAEFKGAMRDYLQATKKDSAHAINRQAQSFCVKSAQKVRLVNKPGIQAIKDEPWWPKVIAGVMKKRAGKLAALQIYQAQWAAKEKGKHRKGAFKLDKQERSYAKEARAISKTLIGNRLKAINFTKWFFLRVARQLSAEGATPNAGAKAFPGIESSVVKATTDKLFAKLDSFYNYKRRGAGSAQGAEKELIKAMGAARSAVIQDMKDYTERQMAKRAAQFSGRKT
jgi:hypothetical protein